MGQRALKHPLCERHYESFRRHVAQFEFVFANEARNAFGVGV